MTANALLQIVLYLTVLLACVKPLGLYMARVYSGQPPHVGRFIAPLERLIYRIGGISQEEEMSWRAYAMAVLSFSLVGFLMVYGLQRVQGVLPLNPPSLSAVSPDSAFNTAVSFTTNTNWQGYGGETTMSYLTQMLGLTVQNFLSAAAGMAVLVALIRGFTRTISQTIGNFWVDLVRGTLYILLPLSLLLAVVLVSQGLVQSFGSSPEAKLVESRMDSEGKEINTQQIAVGPAASQIAHPVQ